MKIVNFNRKNGITPLNTFIDWNKQYCEDLNKKITSLYDYVLWNNPEYLIFNAPSALSGEYNFEPYRSLVDNTVEPRLMRAYETHITIESEDDVTEQKSLFFPSRLNYHQGFYNQSAYGDGLLGSCIKIGEYIEIFGLHSDIATQQQTLWIINSADDEYKFILSRGDFPNIFYRTETSEWLQLTDDKYEDYFNITSAIDGDCFILKEDKTIIGHQYLIVFRKSTLTTKNYRMTVYNEESNKLLSAYVVQDQYYFSNPNITDAYYWDDDSQQWTVCSDNQIVQNLQEYGDNGSYIKTDLSVSKICFVTSTMAQFQTNFPAGYICISNRQPIGENSEHNPHKNDLSAYLIAPIGNGGYYEAEWKRRQLWWIYKANELNNFSNKLIINLAQNCRYFNSDINTFAFVNNQPNVTIQNLHTDKGIITPQLTDKYDNIWTGSDDLVGHTYVCGERMFADVEYSSYRSVVKQQDVHAFNVHTNQPFLFQKVDVLLF